uniref:Chromo domain-containing protein n=1 Tax=Ananas comosus var. bracteatus TaxID=296719 RepID=A0A6V7PS65_ANACO|nr:unnamed protein product [Ananas comosus var. bracteatus]
MKRLRNREIPYVKILWSNHDEREATWELESAMQEHYPYLFSMELEYTCLPSCSFAHACEGCSLQAGTPELAYATVARRCGIGCRSGLPWGVYTTTGRLSAAQAGLPWSHLQERLGSWQGSRV